MARKIHEDQVDWCDTCLAYEFIDHTCRPGEVLGSDEEGELIVANADGVKYAAPEHRRATAMAAHHIEEDDIDEARAGGDDEPGDSKCATCGFSECPGECDDGAFCFSLACERHPDAHWSMCPCMHYEMYSFDAGWS